MAERITFGATVRALRIGGATLTETAHPPGMELPRHTHANANVTFVLSGDFTEQVDRREIHCRPGGALVKPAGACHSNRYGAAGAGCLVVEFAPGATGGVARPGAALGDVSHGADATVSGIGWRLHREVLRPDSLRALGVKRLLAELLDRLDRGRVLRERSRREPSWIRRARERLDAGEPQPAMAELATDAGVHPRHFMRAFRRYVGCLIGEYARRRRIGHAQRVLAETRMSLATVSIGAGFYDQSHFARTFKRLTGLTPGEYRRLTQRTRA